MDYLIAPTLFQNKTCRLPGIGAFTLETGTAITETHNKLINAPVPSIVFTPLPHDKDGFNEFTALSELIKKDLHNIGRVNLKGVGDFVKNPDGSVGFIPVQLNANFTPPVVAEIAIHSDAVFARLVGDTETFNSTQPTYFAEEKIIKDRWWIWAIVLGTIGLAVLVFYLSQHGFNMLGNAVDYHLAK